MRLKITNRTDWRTDDLRRVFQAGMRAVGIADQYRYVTVIYSRTKVSGYAHYHGGPVRMHVPRPKRIKDRERFTRSVAQVWEHELYHTINVKHREMDRDLRWCCQPVPWAEGLEVRERGTKAPSKPAPAPTPTPAPEQPAAHPKLKRAEQNKRRWEKRLATANRMLGRQLKPLDWARWSLEARKAEDKVKAYARKVKRYQTKAASR